MENENSSGYYIPLISITPMSSNLLIKVRIT